MQKLPPRNSRQTLRTIALTCILIAFPTAFGDSEPLSTEEATVTKVKSKKLNEISGLANSRHCPEILWTHNDSGDTATFYAISSKNGTLQAGYHLANTNALDWEDMAIAKSLNNGPVKLYLADMGDNQRIRPNIIIHRVTEPQVKMRQEDDRDAPESTITEFESIWLRYPDGAKDAEGLIVDPTTNDIFIFSKEPNRSRVYRAAYPQKLNQITTLELLGEIPLGTVTAADISFDGTQIIVRNYKKALYWKRDLKQDIAATLTKLQGQKLELPNQPGGESICFDHDGKGLFTISEQKHQPIYHIRIAE